MPVEPAPGSVGSAGRALPSVPPRLADASRGAEVTLVTGRAPLPRVVEYRGAPRYKVFQRGCWRLGGVQYRLHLLDISRTGARAYAVEQPAAGSCIFIDCGETLGLARVSWTNGEKFGVHFAVPLTAAKLDAVAGAALAGGRAAVLSSS